MKKTIFSVILSNFIGAGLSFLLNIALARLLSIEEYGRISLIFTLVIICFSIIEFSFTNANVIFYNNFKKNPDDKNFFDNETIAYLNKLFLKYLIYTVPLFLVILLILRNHYELNSLEIITLTSNYFIFIIFRYIVSLHQAVGEWKTYNILNVLNSLIKSLIMLGMIFISYLYFKDFLYQNSLIGYLIFPFILLLITIFLSKKLIFNYVFSRTYYLKEYIKIILPLGISNIFIVIASRADILIIENILGMEKLGIYAAANSLALVFPLITSALRNVFIRETSNSNLQFLNKIITYQMKFLPYILIFYIITYFLSEYLLVFLFGDKYIESVKIFNILVIAYIGGIVFTPLESYFYSNYQKKILILKFFQMIIVILFCYLLIPDHGLYGAAWSIVLSRLFGWIYILYLSLKLKVKND